MLKIPCVTLREETEWLDTLEDGWNVLAGSDPTKIVDASRRLIPVRQGTPFGEGNAAKKIVDALAYGLTATAISVDGPSAKTAVRPSSIG